MAETPDTPAGSRSTWVRGFYMLLMAIIFHVAMSVMFAIAVIQFVLAVLSDAPNARLVTFGRSLGRYLQQLAAFLMFASEEMPFPFSDWPPGGQA